MAILTESEAKAALSYDEGQDMPTRVTTILLPAIDDFIKNATGHDWAADETIDPLAKAVAMVLLNIWIDPDRMGQMNNVSTILMAQLEAKALVGDTA